MNRILRQRLPPAVKNLLTDIGPKEEYHCTEFMDSESETIYNDGIVLPSRKASSDEEFLTPASKQDRDNLTKDGTNNNRGIVCGLCKSQPSCYTCPRCNVPYCCLACYRSPDHIVCSEEFYKASVLQELKDMGETAVDGRKKMQDILLGLKQKADKTEGGMGSVLREAGVEPDDQEQGNEQAQVFELLSRLAEIQQLGTGDATEMEGILWKLKEISGEGVGELVADKDDEVESEEEQDLADRLSGLDIDSLSEEAMWQLLDSQEKERFIDLMNGKGLEELVHLWRPWWEVHEEGARAVVEVLQESSDSIPVEEECGQASAVLTDGSSSSVKSLSGEDELNAIKESKLLVPAPVLSKSASKKNKKARETSRGERAILPASIAPPISVKIPKLSSLSANASPLVCYGLVNALFGYTFTLTLFNGDIDSLTHEFCDMILDLSEALNSNKIFDTLQQAIECGGASILARGYHDREDPYASDRAVEAVAHIMTGKSRQDALGYCLAALSQIRSELSKSRAALPKGELVEKRRKYFLAGKKCEFYQAWVSDNGHQLRTLAIGLWHEHSKIINRRDTLEKEKRAVEDSWKKGKQKGNGTLIEELN